MTRPTGARSRWINGDIPPNEPGVYERRVKGMSITLNRFDVTDHWLVPQDSVNHRGRLPRSGYQVRDGGMLFQWRGLAARPKR